MPSSGTWRLETEAGFRDDRRGRNESAADLYDEHEELAPSGNKYIWLIPLIFSLGGVIMIASLTSRTGNMDGVSFYWLALRQFQALCVGVVLMYISTNVSLSLIRHCSRLLWIIALLLTVATIFPSLGGVRVGGASRWLVLFGLRFQPLEILTLAVPMYLAVRLVDSKREGLDCFFNPTLRIAVYSAAPLFFQPNMGGMVLIFAICISMHVVSRGWKYPAIGALFLFAGFVGMIFTAGYRMRRLSAFWNPWDDPMGRGFQIIQGLIAFSNGGVWGVGLGRGLQQLNYLPAAHTDYIFPAIGEEFGLVGTLFIVLLYAFWTFRAYMLYRRTDDPYLSVLIWGITASVLFPMFINLGGVLKLIPLTGIPLPFISFGGTSLVFMWVKVGILIRIGKALAEKPPDRGKPESLHSRGRNGR